MKAALWQKKFDRDQVWRSQGAEQCSGIWKSLRCKKLHRVCIMQVTSLRLEYLNLSTCNRRTTQILPTYDCYLILSTLRSTKFHLLMQMKPLQVERNALLFLLICFQCRKTYPKTIVPDPLLSAVVWHSWDKSSTRALPHCCRVPDTWLGRTESWFLGPESTNSNLRPLSMA